MDVKIYFLNGFLNEEVYVHQPPGFEKNSHPHQMFKLTKVLYRLKQAFRAWYERLRLFLIKNNFIKGKIDTISFKESHENDLHIIQVYVDDIIFLLINEKLCNEFSNLAQSEFEMSGMREISFYIGLQIKQL